MNNHGFSATLLFGLGTLLAMQAGAAELRTSIIGATTYSSNVYGSETSEADDLIFRGGAELDLRGNPGPRFDYLFNYRGDYEAYANEDDANAMEHRQRLRLRYDLDRRTVLTLQQRFRSISNLQFLRDDFVTGDAGIDLNQNRNDRNDLAVEVEHALSRRWTLNGTIAHQLVDFERNDDRSDSTTLTFGASARYRLSERHDVGFGLQFANQEFDQAPSRLGAESDYLTAALLWTYRISDRTRLEFSGGPTWIDATQNPTTSAIAPEFVGRSISGDLVRANYAACSPGAGQATPIASRCRFDTNGPAPIPADDLGAEQSFPLDFTGVNRSDDKVEFFGRISLNVGLSDWEIVASYDRRQNALSGESLATSLDALALSVDYRPPARRWQLYSELRLDRRDALIDAVIIDYTVVPGTGGAAVRDQGFLNASADTQERDVVTGLVGNRYAFTSRLSANLEARYRRSERSSGFADGGTSDTYAFEVSLRYDFEPRRL